MIKKLLYFSAVLLLLTSCGGGDDSFVSELSTEDQQKLNFEGYEWNYIVPFPCPDTVDEEERAVNLLFELYKSNVEEKGLDVDLSKVNLESAKRVEGKQPEPFVLYLTDFSVSGDSDYWLMVFCSGSDYVLTDYNKSAMDNLIAEGTIFKLAGMNPEEMSQEEKYGIAAAISISSGMVSGIGRAVPVMWQGEKILAFGPMLAHNSSK